MNNMIKVGVQMFGTSEAVAKNGVENVLKTIKEIGYTSVEMCTIFGSEFPEVQEKLDEMAKHFNMPLPASVWDSKETLKYIELANSIGLEVVSVHAFALGNVPGFVEKSIPEIIEFAKISKIKNIVVSYMIKDAEGCDKVKDDINILIEALSPEGISFCYHNHELEHAKVDGEKNVLDYLIEICDSRLKLQLDVGWAKYGGDDVKETILKYNKRVISLHLKDLDENYKTIDRNDAFTAVGDGLVEIKEAISMSEHMDLFENGIIIDQDNSKTDIMEDLRKGYEFIVK